MKLLRHRTPCENPHCCECNDYRPVTYQRHLMKIRLIEGALALLFFASSLLAVSREAEWKQVEEAANRGLPKTAIERLEPIITGALADKAYPEAIKAIGRKIALEGSIQGNKPEERILRMQAELDKAPAEMKPVMETLLAHWYWQYFQQNRWRFLQRTQTAEPAGADLQTWDLARILTEIDRHFTTALANETKLKTTPITEYDSLLEKESVPDLYRPTLFDFLVYEALQFYQAGEQGAVKGEDLFEVEATSPIFADAAAFLAWRPTSTDEAAPALIAVRLYQKLLTFHRSEADRSAFYDADLARLTFGHNVAVGETKDERYKAALEQFIEATARHEISARASATLATQIFAEGDPVKAHALARRGLEAFPETAGAALCFNLIQQIEAKSAQLETEYVWNAPWPTLNVTYRNLTKVYFRAVRADFNGYVERARWNFGQIDDEQRKEVLGARPALAWSADLPVTKDFKERTEQLPAPTSLKPGFYFIVASHDPSFGETENQVSLTTVWVSDLALVLRLRNDDRAHGGFVLNAVSGAPAAGATVRIWQRDRQGRLRAASSVKTDENGQFQLSYQDRDVVLLAEHQGQAVSSKRGIYLNRVEKSDPEFTQTVFFTDRMLYRPGQTIDYKGICVRYDHQKSHYDTVAGEKLVVVFLDPNGQEIARASQQTNDYGSFSGTFTAPRDRVTGSMSLRAESGPRGMASVRVEEYKRPKFQVELNAPVETAKLEQPVTLTGKATAYTGAPIGGAKVKWRVERGVQLPSWCWWWQPPAVKAIAHGTAITAPDGTYQIQFTATPDRAVPVKNEPVFAFTLHVDVTDTAGETRSQQRAVRAGYTALEASLDADDWQSPHQPVEFRVETKSLDGDAQPAKGQITIHVLKQPTNVMRAPLQEDRYQWWRRGGEEPSNDPTNPDSWELGDVVDERAFETTADKGTKVPVTLKAGIYRALLTTQDRFGKTVTARHTVEVIDPQARHYAVKLPNRFSAPKWSVSPGDKFTAYWGTGYEVGRAWVEVECNGSVLKSYWTAPDRTQEVVEQTVTEEMRGGLTVRITYVRENRAYFNERVVDVPWSNQQLGVKWESFRSKLMPGQKETWTAVVTDPDAKRAAVEMVATLYDASLDQYLPHTWPTAFTVFRRESSWLGAEFQNDRRGFQHVFGWWSQANRSVAWRYRAFPPELVADSMMAGDTLVFSAFEVAGANERRRGSAKAAVMLMKEENVARDVVGLAQRADAVVAAPGEAPSAPEPDLSKVAARKNLNETAFFFPQLIAGEDGAVRMTFTMPEALTEWKFLGFAHDRKLRAGFLTDKVVTAKDLMVEPNPPRFVREGDTIEFTVKVTNQSDQSQTGKVRLTFADAATLKSVDEALANRTMDQTFDLPAKESRSYSWRVSVPDGAGFLTYKAVAATATLSDGEEGFLPVLSRRILVTESLPLPIRGQATKSLEFKKLIESGASDTLRHQSLTVQMTSQPAWYAVMALPYLIEYPYECSEQVFNRLYANALARHIANSDPKIRRTFDLWKNTPALDSPMEKNQDLKAVMLEETPWVREAKAESQARKNVGLLFDQNRLDQETARTLRSLSEQQLNDGLWPWFPGGRPSEYISLYIMTGFGRLRHLGVEIDQAPALKSLAALDAWIRDHYQRIRKTEHWEEYVPSYLDALYLYGRSFYLEDQAIAGPNREAVDFFLRQARKYWLKVDSRQSQAHLALGLQRFGDKPTAQAIMKSIKERSVSNEELGMFWRDTELSWWWYRAPIETQALMIEAFTEVAEDVQAVDDCRVWLLKQKQTQDWKTTKATADAIYGLLLRGGEKLLASDSLVEVALGGNRIDPKKVEAGTGFYEQKFAGSEIAPAMGNVTVKKVDAGVSWGSVHWQYLEDVAKVTPHEGTPLRLKKTLFVKETTGKGQVLKPVAGALSVGDELVVRIELRTDRDMEFVHLKDQRGSGTEPVNVLSRYKYQDGLAYYESTRDTASHFFIDYLPKGTYVFEYSTRVQLKGRYQSGIAEIQCMYAPEFNSHSESHLLEVD